MAQKIGQITNADLYLNGTDVKGRVAELDFGDFGHTEVEHAALGMIGVLKLPGRPVEAIEAKIKFEWLDDEVQRLIINPTKTVRAQLHSYVDIFNADGLDADQSHVLVTHLAFNMMKTSGRTAKLGDQLGAEHDITVHAFSQKVYGEAVPIIEFDAFAGIYNIDGEPVWPR